MSFGEPSELRDRFQRLYLEGGIDGVAVVAADGDRCADCGTYDEQVFTPTRLPPLPITGCTRASGCRCRFEANVTSAE